ncbi:MAG: PDZ domain-containing protein [Bacilli bacterium]|nr:PDZ domain-containing protein [Bacilli bacterium]
MIKKVILKIKKFIKDNLVFFIILFAVNFLITIEVPYYIYFPGGIIDIKDRVSIENEYKIKGSLNLAFVSEIKGTVLTYLLSYVIPNWDLIPEDEVEYDNETYEEINFENKILLEEAKQNAVFVAYSKASHDINITNYTNYVTYISSLAKTDLKTGDTILELDNKIIASKEDYLNIIKTKEIGDKLTLKVKDLNNKVKNRYIKVINYEGEKLTGIYFVTIYKYTSNPKITFNFKDSESGPSGGFMTALSIYSKLTNIDITHGKKIVGTGTIDINGNVGEIGGIEYKLKGAVNEKADIFLVPSGNNYKDAIKLKKKYKYKIDIIEVSSFDKALDYLLIKLINF